ncbi:uncharacterized protein DUF4437 [Litorimonas taeanensis]|uniref:Uncharacterized protein DUF4437 n=1 Tax=Litorimonas taeanensis TaxID=568099 RepID=A0A420WFD2_9PROT|nr:DUF4437 domain-containing protein [Litorimonas taeanensis]RKQ69704.1 uncharacterized protein DUF4437 [Litorimonas taeanensis]
MKNLKSRIIAPFFVVIGACSGAEPTTYTQTQKDSITLMTAEDVSYQPLNPARGDASPQAGVLWGDISKDVASGMVLKFSDGFSSPPHIHNITYRAIVISGAIHNDDPDAANMWMGPGTFWTQPAGEVHITSAQSGVGGTGFLEILEGPYLVQPGELAFESGEHPLNLESSNMVWMNADQMNWIKVDDIEDGPEVTLLWGNLSESALSGSMIRLPPGYQANLSTHGGELKSVIIQGNVTHTVAGVTAPTDINAGSYFASAENIPHTLSCNIETACLVYIRTEGRFQIK